MGDLMRQYGIENPFGTAANFHLPASRLRTRHPHREAETRLPVRLGLNSHHDRAFFRPRGELFAQPADRQLAAIRLRRLPHLLRQPPVRSPDYEIRRRIVGGGDWHPRPQAQTDKCTFVQ